MAFSFAFIYFNICRVNPSKKLQFVISLPKIFRCSAPLSLEKLVPQNRIISEARSTEIFVVYEI